MTRYLLAALLLFVAAPSLFGQSYSLSNGLTITDCNGTLYDDGGAAGNYGDNLNLITKICSDGSGGTHIRLSFSGVLLAPGDELCFYDGPDINAPLIGCASDYPPGQPFLIQASAVNPGGCLTVNFQSNAGGNTSGFAAVISCVPSCQQVLVDLVSTNPTAVPIDTGWIDICPNERIFLTGQGIYPQDGFIYAQSDLTTKFEWNFGDGGISYGPNASHRYAQPGGYYVQLFLTDVQGCRSTNLISQRVRVAPRPNFDLTGVLAQTICAGDTLRLGASVNALGSSTLAVTPNESSFAVEGSRSDSLAIPDGTGVPYQTSIFFTEFSPGQVLTTGSDLESICVNMEHSWIRDLEIKLTCPNGQTAILHNFGGQNGSQVFLGEPNDTDGFNPIPGAGYDYCWKLNASNAPWLQYANTVLGGDGTVPAGDYKPFQSFNNFIGCPLNGEWIFTATDGWPIDNGYLFSWGIKFKDEIYPNIEKFTPQLTSWGWNSHPSIFYTTADSIAAAPQNAGTAAYTFQVNDDFGCAWDTLLTVAVLPFTHPDCFHCVEDYQPLADTIVCAGTPVTLEAPSLRPDTLEVRFEASPDYKLGFANHPHGNPYGAPIAVNSLSYPFLGVPTAQITSVCMDIETDYDSDLNIYLRSPDGKQLELSTTNGGTGKNYKITCFTPTATVPVKGSAAPFNGTYKPEGNWNDLTNAVINGDWKLMVSDGFSLNQFGKVKWWSIGFNFVNTVNYTWSNAASLSCATCPTPTATPAATTTYIVTSTDKFNCQHHDTATVTIATFFPAPANLHVVNVGPTTMTWGWDAVPGALGYEARVNNGGWQTPSGLLMHQVTGLVTGDVTTLEVRALSNIASCSPAISADTSPFVVCVLDAILSSTAPVQCFGTATGSVVVSISNVNPPAQYFPDGLGPAFTNGDLLRIFPVGDHFVVVSDQTGCRDTVFFALTQPDSLVVTITATDALCNADNSGQASAVATGGTGTIDFAWQSCLGDSVIHAAIATNLYAGCYVVTVSDSNGCSVVDSVTIGEPIAYQFVALQDSVSCFGGMDGGASISVTGSQPPYTYAWDNGQTTATATGLDAGVHVVMITDSLGCQAATFVEVFEPPMLVVDSSVTRQVSCFGGNNGTASVFAVGGTPLYQYAWSNAQTTLKAVGLVANTYTVTITDAKNCTVASSVTVGTPMALEVDFINVKSEKCAGDCQGSGRVLAAGGSSPYTYNWDNSSLPPTDTLNALCPGIYTVTVEDARGCTQSNKLTIGSAVALDVHYDPVTPACAGQANGTITTTVAGGSGPYSFEWNTGSSLPSQSNLACGAYSVTLTDAVGCIKTETVQVDCPAGIQISTPIVQPVSCFGLANGSASVQATGGAGTLLYRWNDPSTQMGPLAQNLPAASYTVIVTDDNQCTATATALVTQPPQLEANLTSINVRCFGGNDGTATIHATGGTAPYSYVWSTAAVDSTLVQLSAGTYSVTVRDANACLATSTATIAQPTTPVVVNAIQTDSACAGTPNGKALATAMGNNGPPYTFKWSDGQMGPQAIGLPVGNITVIATDPLGCYSSQVVDIQELDSIEVYTVYAKPLCFGSLTAVAGVNKVEGGMGMGDTTRYSYRWSVVGAPNSTLITGLAGGQSYGLTVTDVQGCSGEFSVDIPEAPEIMLATTVQDVRCFGQSNGSIEITGSTGGHLPLHYLWNTGSSGPKLNDLSAGIYRVTVTDSLQCTTIDTIDIQQPLPITVGFATTLPICTSDTNATIVATVQGGTPGYILQWNTGASTSNLSGLGPGNYSLLVRDSNGCTLQDSVFIPRPDSLNLRLQTIDPQCFGADNGRVHLVISGGAIPYRYSLNGGVFGGSSTFIGLKAGEYTLSVRDGNGCLNSASTTLHNPPPLTASLGPDTTIVLGQSVTLSPEVGNAFGLTSNRWRSALLEHLACVDTPICADIMVQPLFSNTYFVTITDANGCTAKSSLRVSVEKPRGVYVPTGFSPNGDLENDRLVVHGKSRQVRNIRVFQVYDRWGELVFEDRDFNVNDLARGWDGQWRGEDCDPGVYAWYLEAAYPDGYEEALKGEVMLIR